VSSQTLTAFFFTDRRHATPWSAVAAAGFAGARDSVLVHPPPSETARPRPKKSAVFTFGAF